MRSWATTEPTTKRPSSAADAAVVVVAVASGAAVAVVADGVVVGGGGGERRPGPADARHQSQRKGTTRSRTGDRRRRKASLQRAAGWSRAARRFRTKSDASHRVDSSSGPEARTV